MPPLFTGARYTYTTTTYDSVASFQCDRPFVLQGNSTAYCHKTGVWQLDGSCGTLDKMMKLI